MKGKDAQWKEKSERLVFETFIRVVDLRVHKYHNEKPPKPDIAAVLEDGSIVGYEIAELIDEEFAKKLAATKNGVFGGLTSDPTQSILRSKFTKKYHCSYPVELIAYKDHTPFFPEDLWRQWTIEFLDNSQHHGQFRRVWFLDVQSKRIMYEREF